jgi:hypothetical protein
MSKYDAIMMIFNAIPSVVHSYFAMIASGNGNAIIGGLLGLLGIAYLAYNLTRRFWRTLVFHAVFR